MLILPIKKLALEVFNRDVEEMCGLVLQRSKTEVLSWDGRLPAGTPPGLVRAGETVAGQWEPGMICYGIPVGTDAYVEHKLDEKVCELATEVDTVVKYCKRNSSHFGQSRGHPLARSWTIGLLWCIQAW